MGTPTNYFECRLMLSALACHVPAKSHSFAEHCFPAAVSDHCRRVIRLTLCAPCQTESIVNGSMRRIAPLLLRTPVVADICSETTVLKTSAMFSSMLGAHPGTMTALAPACLRMQAAPACYMGPAASFATHQRWEGRGSVAGRASSGGRGDIPKYPGEIPDGTSTG